MIALFAQNVHPMKNAPRFLVKVPFGPDGSVWVTAMPLNGPPRFSGFIANARAFSLNKARSIAKRFGGIVASEKIRS